MVSHCYFLYTRILKEPTILAVTQGAFLTKRIPDYADLQDWSK